MEPQKANTRSVIPIAPMPLVAAEASNPSPLSCIERLRRSADITLNYVLNAVLTVTPETVGDNF